MTILTTYHTNLFAILILGVIVLIIGSILKYFRQPSVIAYILTGVLIGESGFDIIHDKASIELLGEFGLILLLFFIGMEINLNNLIKNWKVPTLGTFLQVLGSLLVVSLIGMYFNWEIKRIIVLGFVISLSSSAVVIKLLQDNNESQSKIGQSVISVLIIQDIIIVPMLFITNYLGGNKPSSQEVILQIIGMILIIGSIIWVLRKKTISIPFEETLEKDRELQVIFAIVVCFGFATLTAIFGLSAALGAFVGGMLVHATNAAEWFHESLHSFRVIFVALFFLSIGLLIDLSFLLENWRIITVILVAVYISNHLLNAIILYYFLKNWRESMYGGALLAQVGELSFMLISSAYFSNIISEFAYQLTIIIISLTLFISPFWIGFTKKFIVK